MRLKDFSMLKKNNFKNKKYIKFIDLQIKIKEFRIV